MELSFTEYDVLDKPNGYTELQNDLKYKTYYDNLIQPDISREKSNNNHVIQPIKKIEKRKKPLSYDDILSSMNTVVIDGKLEFISKDKLNSILENKPVKKSVTFSERQQRQQNHPVQQVDKSSYIYNKFFKDYKDPNQNQYQNDVPQRPLTKKELLNQIIINRIKAVNERNRIAQVKSTKLLFNNNNNRDIVINPTQNQASLNKLFRFK